MMSLPNLSFSLHVLGFVTGIVLYAMLGVMAWQQRAAGSAGHVVENASSAWNAERLIAVATLGLVLSIAGNVLHLGAAMHDVGPLPRIATWVLVIGYAILMGLILAHLWQWTAKPRALALIAIGVFAVSALHLVFYHGGSESLGVELLVHYAPLPLVAVLLYQEYRFALADVFLKRALSLILLVVIAAFLSAVAQEFVSDSVTLFLWIGTALLYPWLQRAVYTGVDRIILRRRTAREMRARLIQEIMDAESPGTVLNHACLVLQEALTARWIRWQEEPVSASGAEPDQLASRARVRIPVADAPAYVIIIGPLAGGRRLLSEDFDILEIVALDVARRIDVLRITTERYERSTREAEALRLATEAELRALHAQLNPHFLFNALTTIGHLIQVAPDRALSTLLRLTSLLRGVLRSAGNLVTLQEEIALIESYLAIEHERFEERLTTRIAVPTMLNSWKIPPLVIQPLVENAIKHGITPLSHGGNVTIDVDTIAGGDHPPLLRVRVIDTGAGVAAGEMNRRRQTGVGLNNIEKRIERYYQGAASMTVTSIPGAGTTVELLIPEHVG